MERMNQDLIYELAELAGQNGSVYAIETKNGFNLTGRFREVPEVTLKSFYDREIKCLLGASNRVKKALAREGMTRVGHIYAWPEKEVIEWSKGVHIWPGPDAHQYGDIERRLTGIENFGRLSLQNLSQALMGSENTAKLNNVNHSGWQNAFLVGYWLME